MTSKISVIFSIGQQTNKQTNKQTQLKEKFSSGIEGALASTLHHDFNWKQLSEMMLCIALLMFSKFICVTDSETAEI